MNRAVKGVIFDWAGTTIDYGCVAPVAVIQKLFAQRGIVVTNDDARRDMGLLKIDHLRKLVQIPSVRSQIESKEGKFDDEKYVRDIFGSFDTEIKKVLKDYCDPILGVRDVVNYLRTKEIKIGSTTGYTKEMMDIVLPIAKSKGYSPDFLVTSDQVPKGRPYPWMVFRNAEQLGLDELHKVVKVGDTVADIREGISAGCWTVGILEGGSEVGLGVSERLKVKDDKFEQLKQKARDTYVTAGADFIINSIDDLPSVVEEIETRLASGERPQNMAVLPRQPYVLFTPGPLSTSRRVKIPMTIDLGSRENNYLDIVQDVRKRLLLNLAPTAVKDYTTVIMQGSGTFGVESVVNSAVPKTGSKFLVCVNGQYGKRMAEIGTKLERKVVTLEFEETETVDPVKLEETLRNDPSITHVGFVHSETTTGLVNPVERLSKVIKSHNKVLIIDSISSLGAIPFDAAQLNCDFAVGSSNKGFQGVPGFSFIIARKSELEKCKGNSTSLSLDLFDQWTYTEKGKGSFRFTTPTHTVVAFQEALKELEEEGGVEARYKRYMGLQKQLTEGMQKLGFEVLDLKGSQGPVITTFHSPKSEKYSFDKFYSLLKEHQCVIYPGKLTKEDTFRIGTIGHISSRDIDHLLTTIKKVKFW